jgi:hypothetical protein
MKPWSEDIKVIHDYHGVGKSSPPPPASPGNPRRDAETPKPTEGQKRCAYKKCRKLFTPNPARKHHDFCCPSHRKRAWFEAHFLPIK